MKAEPPKAKRGFLIACSSLYNLRGGGEEEHGAPFPSYCRHAQKTEYKTVTIPLNNETTELSPFHFTSLPIVLFLDSMWIQSPPCKKSLRKKGKIISFLPHAEKANFVTPHPGGGFGIIRSAKRKEMERGQRGWSWRTGCKADTSGKPASKAQRQTLSPSLGTRGSLLLNMEVLLN